MKSKQMIMNLDENRKYNTDVHFLVISLIEIHYDSGQWCILP